MLLDEDLELLEREIREEFLEREIREELIVEEIPEEIPEELVIVEEVEVEELIVEDHPGEIRINCAAVLPHAGGRQEHRRARKRHNLSLSRVQWLQILIPGNPSGNRQTFPTAG